MTPLRHMDPPALERRRSELYTELNAVNDEIARREREASLKHRRERDLFLATQVRQTGKLEPK